MKNKLHFFIFLLPFMVFLGNAQDSKLKKANKYFENFEYSKAISKYEKLVDKGQSAPEIYENLGDANYFNANYEQASKWYGQLAATSTDALDLEHLYRYASSLRSIREYEASGTLLKKLRTLKGYANSRPVSEYMKEIKDRFGSYTIENIEINSAASDFAPSFRVDGLVFSTGRDTSGVSKTVHNWNKKRFLNLFTATNTEDGGFKNIMRFSDKLNTKLHESSTVFTKDGTTVYFTRNKEHGKKFGRDKKGISRLKLYKAVFENNKWGNVQKLPFNQDGFSVAHPALNKAENKLYFAADIFGTEGLSDIFVVDINADGSYGIPKNLGANINTVGRETFPHVSDEDILYFASDGHPGLGGLDIFAVDLNHLETSNIVNLGEPLNSVSDDFSFIINAETKKGYFASNRDGGMGDDDIYALTELKPIDTRCFSNLSGIVKDKETGNAILNSIVTLFNENGQSVADTKSDSQGSFTLQHECKNGNYVIVATKETHEPERKTYEENAQNDEAQVITLVLSRIDTGAPIGTDLAKYLDINPIYFDLDKAFIREDAMLVLEKIIAYMNQYPDANIEVRSHTDSRGSSNYNKSLSARRAKETITYIIAQGIASSRIKGNGFGETTLTNECKDTIKCSNEKHQQNRRSEFIVIE